MTTLGRPTIARYIEWARAEGFGVVTTETVAGDQRLIIVELTGENGQSSLEVVETLQDPITSTTVARLDRGLGRKSWLFA